MATVFMSLINRKLPLCEKGKWYQVTQPHLPTPRIASMTLISYPLQLHGENTEAIASIDYWRQP